MEVPLLAQHRPYQAFTIWLVFQRRVRSRLWEREPAQTLTEGSPRSRHLMAERLVERLEALFHLNTPLVVFTLLLSHLLVLGRHACGEHPQLLVKLGKLTLNAFLSRREGCLNV